MRIVHQIAISDHSLDNFVPENKKNLEKYFLNYDYLFWDFPQIKKFILSNGDFKVLDAINNINANAFKADVARYYIIYKMGGWYVDLNNFFQEAPPEEYDFVVFSESRMPAGAPWGIQNGLFYFKQPNHHCLKRVVDICVDNISKRYYGFNPFFPTGPNAFGMALAHNLPEDSNHFFGEFVVEKENFQNGFYMSNFYQNNDQPLALYKPYHGFDLVGNPRIPGSNNYVRMWQERKIYGV
jgi:hypothetical protein